MPHTTKNAEADPRVAAIAEHVEANRLKEAEALYAELKAQAQAAPRDLARAQAQAQAAVTLILGLGLEMKLEDVLGYFQDVLALAAFWPKDARIALERANASYRLIYHLGTAKQPDNSAALYAELRELAQAHSEDPRFALALAKGATNLIGAYATANRPDQAQAVYDELKALAERHPGNAEMALQQAKGAVNLSIAYAEADKLDETQAVYDELKVLVQRHPDNAVMALQQAKGAVSLTAAYATAIKPDQAQAVYDELKALAESRPGNAEMALEQARGVFNVGVSFERLRKGEEARRAYQEAEALCAPLTSPEAQKFRATIDRALVVVRMTAPELAAKPPKAGPPAGDGAARPAPGRREPLPPRMIEVLKPLKEVKDAFTEEMTTRRQRVQEFLKDESLFAHQASVFLVLRKWNSFTPIIMDGQESDRGGGYFLYHKGVGLVIDPGYDFIEQFHEAGGQIHDITHIAVTHAHDDHTAQLEQLLTMLHQYNKEREKEGQKEKRKQVTLLLNHSAMKRFSGFRLHKDCAYVKRVVCLNAFDEDAEPQRVRLDAAGELEMTVLPAHHDDVFSADYAVGLGFTVGLGENRRVLVLTSDTGLFPPRRNAEGKVETYGDGEKMVCEDQPERAIHVLYPEPFKSSPDLLIAHIGSIKEYEFEPQSDSSVPIYYPNHLGFLGTSKLLIDMQPKAVILSEFGSELKSLRMDIAGLLLQALDKDPFVIPGDNTLVYDFAKGEFLCHSDCQFHDQADIVPSEVETAGEREEFIGLFLKGKNKTSLKMFMASKKQLRDPHKVPEAVPLPYMRPKPG